MLQFKLPAVHSVRIQAGEVQGFTPYFPPRACCHIRPRREWRSSRLPAGWLPLWGGRRWTWGANGSVPHTLGWGGDWGDQRYRRVGRLKIGWWPLVEGLRVLRPRFWHSQLPSGRLSGCCRLWLGLLRPSRLPGGCHFRLLGSLLDRLGCGFRIWCWSGVGLDNTPPSDDVVPGLAQIRLLGKGPGRQVFRSRGVACGGALSDVLWRSLCKGRLRFFPLDIGPVTRSVFAPAATAMRQFTRGSTPTGKVGATHETPRGLYPQLRCVCPKRWQRLHCNGPFEDTYDSTDSRRPQCSVIDHNIDTSGPRVTDTMKWGWGVGTCLGPCRDAQNAAAWDLQRLPDDALRHLPAEVLHQVQHPAVLRERKGVENYNLPPSSDRSALTTAIKP